VHAFSNLSPETNLGSEAMEFMAIEGYRAGTLSHRQASQILGLSHLAFDAFLKDRHIHDRACEVQDIGEEQGTSHLLTPA